MHPSLNRTSATSRFTVQMMWWLYNVGMLVGLLLTWPLLICLAAASKKRRHTVIHRLGLSHLCSQVQNGHTAQTIWVHALSVGEVAAAQALIQGLRERYGHHRIVLTASTHTGYEAACRMLTDAGVTVTYFPYDLIFSVRAIANLINPTIVILTETDIWPNFMSEMKRRNVPVYLANFRLSDATWRRCRSFKRWTSQLFESFEKIFTQTQEDTRRLLRLGVVSQRIHTAGSLKFDINCQTAAGEMDGKWRQRLRIEPQRLVIVAGSTHKGDEAVLLKAFTAIRASDEAIKALLIIAPRDPDRSLSIVALCHDFKMSCHLLSQLQSDASIPCPDVVVVDYFGILKELYGLADVAFIGGSLSNEGGHNPLEPAMYGKPILFGPDMRDFKQMVTWLLESGGAQQVINENQLCVALSALLKNIDVAVSMGLKALSVYQNHKGAVAKMLDNIVLH